MLWTFLSYFALVTGCFTAKLVEPTPEDLQRAQKQNPAVTMETLNQGKMHYQTYCTKCHGLKPITKYSPQQWEKIVADMSQKHNRKFPQSPITEEQQSVLLTYLQTISQRKHP